MSDPGIRVPVETPNIPRAWSEGWFRGWYRDVLLRLAKPLIRDCNARPSLHDFGARTVQEAGPNYDSTKAIQDAFDYYGAPGGALGTVTVHPGVYRINGNLKHRIGTTLRGAGNSAVTNFVFYTSGSVTPYTLDGENGSSDGSRMWVWNSGIEDLWFDMSHITTTAPQAVLIDGAYSSDFNRWSIMNPPASKTPIKIGRSNELTFRKLRVYGDYLTQNNPQLVLVDSSSGEINLLRFDSPDLEQGANGFNFVDDSSHYRVTVDIYSLYSEALDKTILWNAGSTGGSAQESRLNVIGGQSFGKNSGAIGVDIRKSNCLVQGFGMGSIGAIGVDIDNATEWLNCHVIGGNLHVTIPVRDTYDRLTTNTYA